MEYLHIREIDFQANINQSVFGIFLARDVEVRTQKDGVTKFLSLNMCDKDVKVDVKKFGATEADIEKIVSDYVAGLVSGSAEGLQLFLPAIIFIIGCFLAFATGTSWGTFGILIPICIAIFPVGNPLRIISISACMAGAVCGDHCSPISDTTIMASAGSQSNHINHVSTQLPYALTVAGVSFVTYIIAGFVQKAYIALPIGIVLMLGTLFLIKAMSKKKA